MRYKLDRSSHSVYNLNYHLILVVKYRRKALKYEDVRNRLYEIIQKLINQYEVEIINMNTGDDHIHILFKAKPKLCLSKFINMLKGVTARYLRKEFPKLKKMLWGDSFWSDSYFVATTGQVSLDTLIKYVESQGEKKK